MKNHIYVIVSVLLWGISQFLIDKLLAVFSPILLILLRFFIAGILLLLITKKADRKPFHWKYIITGGLGAFGYYILSSYALVYSSVTFVAIMGGILPALAIIIDRLLGKQKARKMQILGAGISILGIFLFSYAAQFEWSVVSLILMVVSNLCWLFYSFLKKKWNSTDDSCVLGYEFIGSAILTIPFFANFTVTGTISIGVVACMAASIILATILPYQLYLRGSKGLSLSTASMYMNLLPIASLIPVLVTGGLSLSGIQIIGIGVLISAAVVGK